jgi:hypothetical protein
VMLHGQREPLINQHFLLGVLCDSVVSYLARRACASPSCNSQY